MFIRCFLKTINGLPMKWVILCRQRQHVLLQVDTPSLQFALFEGLFAVLNSISVILASQITNSPFTGFAVCPVLGAHFYASNWQLPYLNQRSGKKSTRKDFMTNPYTSYVIEPRIKPMFLQFVVRHLSNWAYQDSIFSATFKSNNCLHLQGMQEVALF